MQNNLKDLCQMCNKQLNEIEKIGNICNDCLKREYEIINDKGVNSSFLLNITIIKNDFTKNIG